MRPRKGIARAAGILVTGQLVAQALSFIRNLILARYLAQADYGMSAAFALSVSLLEIAGRMAFGQQTVQSRHGAQPEFQSTAHAFQFAAASTSALLLLVASPLLARLFGVPDLTWAFATLAVVPLCMGLEHLDIYRHQRELRFLPSVTVELVPQIVATLALAPLLVWFNDFRAFLAALVLKALMSLGISHAMATCPYRFGWCREHARAMRAFGVPLLLNGVFLFAGQQADQFVIGSFLSLQDLALYSIPVSMLAVPWIIFARVLGPIMLPTLAQLQQEPRAFAQRFSQCLELSAAATLVVSTPFMVSGGTIAGLLFGPNYSGLGQLCLLLAIASALRFLRFAPTVGSMALGDTRNQMYANLVRSSGLVLVLGTAALGGSVLAFATAAIAAEAAALITSMALVKRRVKLPQASIVRSTLVLLAAFGTCSVLSLVSQRLQVWASLTLAGVVAVCWGGICMAVLPSLRQFIAERRALTRARPGS